MKYLILTLALACGMLASCGNAQDRTDMEKNETVENLKTRRSIRAYQDRMPPKEILEQIAEAGTYAPTGKGSQSPIIVAVTDKAMRDSLSRLNAAVMGTKTDPFNAAHALGLGSCWIHRAKEVFDTEEGKALLKSWGIEGDYEGIGNCILGYPAQEAPAPKARKSDYVRFVE